MEILKSLIGQNVKVFTFVSEDNDLELHVEGKLKNVDSKGILLINNTLGKALIYFKHEDYIQINVEETGQNSEGIFSAFRQKQKNLWDLDE